MEFVRQIKDMTNKLATKLLQDADPALNLLGAPPEESEEVAALEDDDPASICDALPPLFPDSIQLDEWKRAKVHVDGSKVYKVIFDHFSSDYRRQRGYCDCKDPRHNNCFKWQFTDQHQPRNHGFALLARWAEDSGLYLTREAHMKAIPQPEDVQAALISLDTEDF